MPSRGSQRAVRKGVEGDAFKVCAGQKKWRLNVSCAIVVNLL
jgi:hypothetical protein